MNRISKGDLVQIKSTNAVGIVVDVVTRSTQNPDWDVIAVLCDGWVDDFSPRMLIKKDCTKFEISVKDVKKLDTLIMNDHTGETYAKKRKR